MKLFSRFIMLCVLIFLLGLSCSQNSTRKIAVVYSAVPVRAGYEKAIRAAVTLRINEINQSKILPYRVEAEFFDNKGDTRVAKNNARKITTKRNVVAVCGYVLPECLAAVMPIYAKQNLPVITPAVSAENPFAVSGSVAFRAALSHEAEGKALALFVDKKLQSESVVVLYQVGHAYDEIRTAFRSYASNTFTIVTNFRYKAGEVDFRNTASRIASLNPETVVLVGTYWDTGVITSALRNELGSRINIVCSSKTVHNDFIKMAGRDNARGVYAVSSFLYTRSANERIDNFNDEYAKLNGRYLNRIAFHTYNAMSIIEHALLRSDATRVAILEHLHSLQSATNAAEGLAGPLFFHGTEMHITPIITTVQWNTWQEASWKFSKDDVRSLYKENALGQGITNTKAQH